MATVDFPLRRRVVYVVLRANYSNLKPTAKLFAANAAVADCAVASAMLRRPTAAAAAVETRARVRSDSFLGIGC